MRRSFIALAGLVGACALNAGPALGVNPYYSAYSAYPEESVYSAYATPTYGDPLSRGGADYYDQDVRPQAAPIPRQLVQFDARYAPGSIVISTEERRLYYLAQRG